MFVLSVHVVEGMFVTDEGFLAEVSAAVKITSIGALGLLFVTHFLLELEPLSLELHDFFTVEFFLYLELIFSVLDGLGELVDKAAALFVLLSQLLVFAFSLG
jgi:hypothetical protein